MKPNQTMKRSEKLVGPQSAQCQLQPVQTGLYVKENEHDACGVGMIVDIHGAQSHELVEQGLEILEHMKHRGAEGADNATGDGAGILLQIPHEFILLQGIPVPEKGHYGTGLVFLPREEKEQTNILAIVAQEVERMGLKLSHVRPVPVHSEVLGPSARATEPSIVQIFVVGPFSDTTSFERKLYLIRKHIERRVEHRDFYIVSLSSQRIVYKGMLSSTQLRRYFADLTQPYFTSGLAIVHSRFSTNTFPTWSLAQPFRLLAHNGEINTIRGNRGWMAARQSVLDNQQLGRVSELAPILEPGMSDSASLDNALEFFLQSGLSLPHAMAMLVPESFNEKNPLSEDLKAFYEYHSILMEPWDGPAALLFSDGRYAGGMLDRNGLRPARYLITKTDKLICASEAGVVDVDAAIVKEKGVLRPGKILLVDTHEGRILRDADIKAALAAEHPYRQWLREGRIELDKLKSGRHADNAVQNYDARLRAFGFTREDLQKTIVPMCLQAKEPTASMGNDTPLAVLSSRPQNLFNYFRQQFAQVTNPAIDPIREELVMSLIEYIGAVGTNILQPSESHCKMVRLPCPILNNTQLDLLCHISYKGFKTVKLPLLFDPAGGAEALKVAIDRLCHEAERSVDEGVNYIILSDRDIRADRAAVPSLLAVSAVHHYLIKVQKRVQTALIVESGEIREVMHAALLLGYGASAINPYMVFAILDDLTRKGDVQLDYATAERNYIKAVCKGLYKIMSKMGISTIRSYRGAKIFESVGLSAKLLSKYFGTSISTIGGIGLKEIAADYAQLHAAGFAQQVEGELLPHMGLFSYRKNGKQHAWNPDTIAALQLATRTGSYEKFKQFAKLADQKESPIFIRDFFAFKQNPIDIDEVEPEEEIIKHFVAGAMSFGAISKEAHEAIALAMNHMGARSNTGEGGEDSTRFTETIDGISLSSKTKQVASGRFGVTTEYLVNAEEIQIKVAQGAKPGEGGQLPGFKVNEVIARTRHSIPGISLISPPPHHDIYSIEDLAQLIFDLKNVNPHAQISVKLVAESGIGTIAAGVAKAKADLIVISGAEGGTGASPASSMRYAGIPAEIGLSETQQTLVLNNLRGQVRLQTDGQLKTGRDVVCMALLGAEEFGFGTAVLVVLGCLLMRKCHANTCPVGVATQDGRLRAHFRGSYHYVENYFHFVARQVREYLAQMGFRHLSDIVGRSDLIEIRGTEASPRYAGLDFSRLLQRVDAPQVALHHTTAQIHEIDHVLDVEMLHACDEALRTKQSLSLRYDIRNTNRSVGCMLSGHIARLYGEEGLPDHSLRIRFDGSAGQSFGAFLVHGVEFTLVGEANDYLGKGLSGGTINVVPFENASYDASQNIIAGNTLLYGATEGELYINGQVGERFAVRNSGAIAVVEGVGDHCCEYMTGGRVVVLGPTGSNFAAGMSGGIAYVWDREHHFDYFCNMDMVELSLVEDSTSASELRHLVEQHYEHTHSARARQLLDDWNHYLEQFIQVTPIEYKKVMAEEQMQKLQRKIAEVQRDY